MIISAWRASASVIVHIYATCKVLMCFCVAQLWVAPEVLRLTEGHTGHLALYGSREADVYSFGVIMQEIATNDEPYSAYDLDLEGERSIRPGPSRQNTSHVINTKTTEIIYRKISKFLFKKITSLLLNQLPLHPARVLCLRALTEIKFNNI